MALTPTLHMKKWSGETYCSLVQRGLNKCVAKQGPMSRNLACVMFDNQNGAGTLYHVLVVPPVTSR